MQAFRRAAYSSVIVRLDRRAPARRHSARVPHRIAVSGPTGRGARAGPGLDTRDHHGVNHELADLLGTGLPFHHDLRDRGEGPLLRAGHGPSGRIPAGAPERPASAASRPCARPEQERPRPPVPGDARPTAIHKGIGEGIGWHPCRIMRRRSILTIIGVHHRSLRLARHRRGWVGTRVLLGTASSLGRSGRATHSWSCRSRRPGGSTPFGSSGARCRPRQYRAGTPAPLYGAHAARLPRASAVRLGDRCRLLRRFSYCSVEQVDSPRARALVRRGITGVAQVSLPCSPARRRPNLGARPWMCQARTVA